MADGADAKPRWSFNRVLLLVAIAAVLLAIFASGGYRLSVFVSIESLLLVPGILAVGVLLLVRPWAWVYLVAAVGALLVPFVLIVIVTHGRPVFNPLVQTDFFAKVLLLLAAAVAVPAGVSGFLRARRGMYSQLFQQRLHTPHGAWQLLALGVAVGAVLAGQLALAHAPDGASPIAYDVPVGGSIPVKARYFAFAPDAIEVPAGKLTEVVLENEDIALHTFTYTFANVTYDHVVYGGQTSRFAVLFPAAGTVTFWCTLHSPPTHDKDMVGTMRVV